MYLGFCTHCGAPFQGDERFCTHCGTPREVGVTATCGNCGQPVEGTGLFCIYCGAPLRQEAPARGGEAVREEPARAASSVSAVAPAAVASGSAAPATVAPEQKKARVEKPQPAEQPTQPSVNWVPVSQAPVEQPSRGNALGEPPSPEPEVGSAYDDEAAMSIDYVEEGAITICPGCSAILDASVTRCTQCGRVLVDEPESMAPAASATGAAEQAARQEQARAEASMPAQAREAKKALDQSAPPVRPLREYAEEEDEYQTLVLSEDYRSEDFSETTILVEQNLVSLFRKATGEMFVAEPPLVLGRGSEASCCVTGNSAISRKHAEIVSRDGKYYLSDLGSANKTKIGGVALSPHALVEIQDETEFALGDEEFVFHVGEKWCLAAAQAAGRA